MKGARPLSHDDIRKVADAFDGTFAVRNRNLFLLGVSVGGRISELLALTLGDVWQNSKPVADLLFRRGIVKGGEVSRTVPVNADGTAAIRALIEWHREQYAELLPARPLFPSRKGTAAILRTAAHEILKKAFDAAGLNGKLATHSMRKSYAQRLYEATGDIYAVQEMLGHRNVTTTQAYLGIHYEKVRAASEQIAVVAAEHPTPGVSPSHPTSLQAFPDEALVMELLRRGYTIAKPEDTPGEAGLSSR